MGPVTADPRIEAIRRILDTVPMRPAQHDLDQAAADIVAALDELHAADGRTCITFDDETEE